nr:recombinational DNA repair protein (RecE pathway) [bacterium]
KDMVISKFTQNVGEVSLNNFQKRLAQNYFIAIDAALKMAENKRNKNNFSNPAGTKYHNDLAYLWKNINYNGLPELVVANARIGLDPAVKNHISFIFYKNNALKKYDVAFREGYAGIELKAKKYGLDVPDSVICEIVYSKDEFIPIKKTPENRIEGYNFNILSPFDRGDIIGGFYYYEYVKEPEKNKLVIFALKDILKRKPKTASAEFWGGEKWNKEDKCKEKIEGWFDEMCLKTIKRAAYGAITIDSQKIDSEYLLIKQREEEFSEYEKENIIEAVPTSAADFLKGENEGDNEKAE